MDLFWTQILVSGMSLLSGLLEIIRGSDYKFLVLLVISGVKTGLCNKTRIPRINDLAPPNSNSDCLRWKLSLVLKLG
ncbi:hypothetical protein TPPAVE_037 [Candidatus Tremblaya phenacola PAVE]|nr:hypothetical protein TPPAVE_037 [Candidatus Tremblaya phenacola PAVE]